MSEEIFYPVIGFEEDYYISTIGRIYSVKRSIFLKGTKNNNDAIIFSLYKNGNVHYTNLKKIMKENGLYKKSNVLKGKSILNISEKCTLEF
jgi:hypothetical protein